MVLSAVRSRTIIGKILNQTQTLSPSHLTQPQHTAVIAWKRDQVYQKQFRADEFYHNTCSCEG